MHFDGRCVPYAHFCFLNFFIMTKTPTLGYTPAVPRNEHERKAWEEGEKLLKQWGMDPKPVNGAVLAQRLQVHQVIADECKYSE